MCSVRRVAEMLRDGLGFLGAARCLVLFLEPVDTSSRVHQLLTAREKRVAGRADFHADVAFMRGTGLESMSAGAGDVDFVVRGVNTSLHFVAGSPFENLSIAKIPSPVAAR